MGGPLSAQYPGRHKGQFHRRAKDAGSLSSCHGRRQFIVMPGRVAVYRHVGRWSRRRSAGTVKAAPCASFRKPSGSRLRS
eukprot:6942650-Alexandrium_andersonii.AAC.1